MGMIHLMHMTSLEAEAAVLAEEEHPAAGRTMEETALEMMMALEETISVDNMLASVHSISQACFTYFMEVFHG